MSNHMSSQRQIRYGELIRSLISDCLLKEDFYDQSISSTSVIVSYVKMSKDLKMASVYLMPLGGENKLNLLENIKQKKYIFQRYLSKAKLKSKFTPKINFFIDDTFDEAEKIEKLLLDKKVQRDLNG
ncbi:uncharacterized protein METZ01_LOCUS147799 [marine metagenome]|uniref:Ribosome-binding factor A n=1 Tax=marine metagenome TaxID=408172 RepID=A0A382A093_9ZZZZ